MIKYFAKSNSFKVIRKARVYLMFSLNPHDKKKYSLWYLIFDFFRRFFMLHKKNILMKLKLTTQNLVLKSHKFHLTVSHSTRLNFRLNCFGSLSLTKLNFFRQTQFCLFFQKFRGLTKVVLVAMYALIFCALYLKCSPEYKFKPESKLENSKNFVWWF
jgi:hypothetical protein